MNQIIKQTKRYTPFFLRLLIALFFIVAGISHFTNPSFFLEIMPPFIPFHKFCVAISGLFEIIGGLGLLCFGFNSAAKLRLFSGRLLIFTLIAVYPANIHMALQPDKFSHFGPNWALYLRLPLQIVFVGLVYYVSKKKTKCETKHNLVKTLFKQ